MTHSAVYCALIESRKQSPLPEDQYGEEHHIVPKSEGGSDDKANLVRLTAREHYIAHLLLAKIYDDAHMLRALMMMQHKSSNHQRNFKFNSHLYEKMRLKFSKSISGENHWNYGKPAWNSGKTGVYSAETHKKISENTKQAMSKPEVRKRISNALVGKCFWTDETKQHMSKKNSGKGNPFYGKTHSPEVRKKISEANKGENHPNFGKHLSKETKQKISESKKGTHWFNDGSRSIRAKECPPGFVQGILKKKSSES